MRRVLVVGGGIAGLAAGYWIAERSRAAGRPLDVRVAEAGARAGGNICTARENGFVVEGGPNGWLDREPAVPALLEELGLTSSRIEARPAARRRYTVRGGRLCRVPDSPPTLLTSRALSPTGKLRLLFEPFAAGPPTSDMDETVFEFAQRRVGSDAAEFLVDAAISGITAGDSRRLSVAAAFPLMVEMEREHGSLIRAMAARRKQGPTRLASLDRGLGSVIEALEHSLGDRLVLGAPVTSLTRNGRGFRARMGGNEWEADRVVLALPAWRAAPLLSDIAPGLAGDVQSIPTAGLAVVALAYRAADVANPLDGYGYLVTRGERRDTLGVVWESSLFEGRAPEGTVLVRAMLGGARRPECVRRSPEDLELTARSEMSRLLGVWGEPIQRWVFQWPRAIPQYECGHLARLDRIRAAVAEHPGLHLCGTSFDGVSFASAIASANRVAARVVTEDHSPRCDRTGVSEGVA